MWVHNKPEWLKPGEVVWARLVGLTGELALFMDRNTLLYRHGSVIPVHTSRIALYWSEQLAPRLEADEYLQGFRCEKNEKENIVEVELIYPRRSKLKVEIGLEDVRAADSIRISYDYDRDGWVVKQASTFSWECDVYDKLIADGKDPYDWQEVAFIEAWKRQVPGPGDDDHEGPT